MPARCDYPSFTPGRNPFGVVLTTGGAACALLVLQHHLLRALPKSALKRVALRNHPCGIWGVVPANFACSHSSVGRIVQFRTEAGCLEGWIGGSTAQEGWAIPAAMPAGGCVFALGCRGRKWCFPVPLFRKSSPEVSVTLEHALRLVNNSPSCMPQRLFKPLLLYSIPMGC